MLRILTDDIIIMVQRKCGHLEGDGNTERMIEMAPGPWSTGFDDKSAQRQESRGMKKDEGPLNAQRCSNSQLRQMQCSYMMSPEITMI